MPTLRQLVLIFLLISLSPGSYAQDLKFKAGYYITNRQDTVRGYFHVDDKLTKPYMFKFKNELDSKEYDEIFFAGYSEVLIGKELLVPWYGTRGMSYISSIDYVLMDIDKVKTETIPIKQIYKGSRFSLYHFYDVTNHYFIGDGNEIQELIISYRYPTISEKALYLQNPPSYIKIATFQNQLMALLGADLTKKIKNYIESCTYERNPLIKALKKMENLK